MRVIKYLKFVKGSVALIICLLIVQAFCDLSLPRYTADIVDVGIQQEGINDAAPSYMTDQTYQAVKMLAGSDASLIADSYTQEDDGTYALNDEGRSDLSSLDEAMTYPIVMVHYASQMEGFDLDTLLKGYQAGMISDDQIAGYVDQGRDVLDQMGTSIVSQQAIAAVRSEYEELGIDTSSIQMNYLFSVGVRMLLLALLGAGVGVGVSFLASRSAAHIGHHLRHCFFSRVVEFSSTEIERFSTASLITRGTNDIQQIQMVSVILLRMVLYAPILAIGGIYMVLQTNVAMGWVIALAVAVLICVIIFLTAIAMPKFKMMQRLIDRVNLIARELLTGLPVIRAFCRQKVEAHRFDVASKDLMSTQLFTNRVMTFMMPLIMCIMNATSVLIVWVGGDYIDQGVIQTGDMIAFITYAMVIIMGFLMMSMVAIMLPRADVAAQRINEVLETQSSINDPNIPRDSELNHASKGSVRFEHVDFSYGSSEERVLTDISFTMSPGTTPAIIGSTGSGKSTILSLLMRFYDPTKGSILLDGIDIRELTQHTLRSAIGYVPQRAFLFSGTIASNVGYSRQGMSQDTIDTALSIAQADDFVASRKEGLASPVSQGGSNVSGGQRQRLAIARALASDARVLLFDDSFSALDYATDAALRHALNERLSDRSVLIVAQRIATIRSADTILVLDEGRIVGKGTHDELMKSCTAYREIASSQLSASELSGGGVA